MSVRQSSGIRGERRVPVYRYKAAQLDGKTLRGEMQAPSRAALQEQLQEKELYLTDCVEVEKKRAGRKLDAKLLAEYCRELGMMLGAGVPLTRALSIMARRDVKQDVKDAYLELHRQLKQGSMLSDAMTQLGIFPDLLISMFRASEASGSMDQTAMKMADHYEKSYRLSRKVRSAMTYPIILGCITVVVLLVVFLLVLPRFFELFASLDTPLPGITQFMLNFSVFLRDNWMWLLIGILVLVLAVRALSAIPSVKIALGRFKLRMPVVGKLLKVIYTARFARTFSSCYASGISIISALSNTKDTIDNAYIAAQFPQLIRSVRDGQSLSAALKVVDGFDAKLAASILIGEETGKLHDMLEATADSFDYDSEMALARLTTMIEPLMIVLMALVIGTVIVSVMLPMTTLYDAIGASA